MHNMEKKWQERWKNFNIVPEDHKELCSILEGGFDPASDFEGFHARHFILSDMLARYQLACQRHVVRFVAWHPLCGRDKRFFLPKKTHPQGWVHQAVAKKNAILESLGSFYGRLASASPNEFKKHQWAQKVFIDFYTQGFIEHRKVLNNRLAHPQENLEENGFSFQWFLKKDLFAQDLLLGLSRLSSWPASIKALQNHRIGKSQGFTVDFKISQDPQALSVFTTRPEMLFGASFLALSPDHPKAIQWANYRSDLREFADNHHKSLQNNQHPPPQGIDTHFFAHHPLKEEVLLPIFITNYLIADYGTGATIGCPAHDKRDFFLAKSHGLPIIPVVHSGKKYFYQRLQNNPYKGEGIMINSSFLDGLTCKEAREQMISRLEKVSCGKRQTCFRLRDWCLSSRGWGCPIPVIHCKGCGPVMVPEQDLPVSLPSDFSMESPCALEDHPTWKHVGCPSCGKSALRETNTLHFFFDAIWDMVHFYLLSWDGRLEEFPCPQAFSKWMPVHYHIASMQNGPSYLLYTRLFMQAFAQCYKLDVVEPFEHLVVPPIAPVLPNPLDKSPAPTPSSSTCDSSGAFKTTPWAVPSFFQETNLEETIKTYGADAVRLFLLSSATPCCDVTQCTQGLEGAWRYIKKLLRVFENNKHHLHVLHNPEPLPVTQKSQDFRCTIHQFIDKATHDIKQLRAHVYIARLRSFFKDLEKLSPQTKDEMRFFWEGFDVFLRMASPAIPHTVQEIWSQLGRDTLIHETPWPLPEPALLMQKKNRLLPVQINGKIKGHLLILPQWTEEDVCEQIHALPFVKKACPEGVFNKLIVIPGRMISVVV